MNMHFHFSNSFFYLVMSSLLILCNGCGSTPSTPNPKVDSKTQSVQQKLGPILGPVTKAKIIDRLEGYPVCGMKSEPQKQTLILRFHALGKTVESSTHSVVEVECFFLGFQGLFEYYALEHQTGKITPIRFDWAQSAAKKINASEPKSPVSITNKRYEVCGVPSFDAQTRRLKSLCKGQADGACGAYAEYELIGFGDSNHDPKAVPTFAKVKAHFRSCAAPQLGSPLQWPSLR